MGRFETFVQDITEIDQYWRRIAAAEMAKYGLKGRWTIYFTQLYHNREGLTFIEMQKLCCKDKGDLSRDMRRLEEMGYVEKFGRGAYRKRFALTEKGLELTRQIVERTEAVVDIVGSTLTDRERATFYKAFGKIAQRLKEFSEELEKSEEK